MDGKERLTAIIGIRVYPSWKEEAKRVAKERGISLSDFIYECVELGWEKIISEEDVKHSLPV